MHNKLLLASAIMFCIQFFDSGSIWGQNKIKLLPFSLSEVEKKIAITQPKQKIVLSDSFLIAFTDSLVWRNHHLIRGQDYRIDYAASEIVLKLKGELHGDSLLIYYRKLPLPLKRKYAHRQIELLKLDSTHQAAKSLGTHRSGSRADQFTSSNFAANLRRSGSLVRGVSIGTNQGLKVDSGLRLQVSGKVSETTEVVAALTDQNTPIQPEGNTQTLQEIDKVFIQLKGNRFGATLGDYQLGFSGTEFAGYRRKLQGAMAHFQGGPARVTIFGAVSRGKFRTQQFMGREGNQGPYQLTGDRGQIDIIVLAGTERVWIDGELMVRGENNDYVIEYGNGQITFSRNRLITADSRITVDFQYSDERFQRNLFGAEAIVQSLNNKLKIRTTLLREGDDKRNPLTIPLNDEFLAALSNAGDREAMANGAKFVGPGKGNYVRQDSIFRFVGADSGDFQVRFSDLGEGNGSYRYSGFGHYAYVGPGQGRYAPVLLLPKATQNNLADFRVSYNAGSGISLISEMALSQFDKNLYSSLDDEDNGGRAYLFEIKLSPENWSLFGRNLGKAQIRLRHRSRGNTFSEIDRVNIVEYGRRWDLTTNSPQSGEVVTEAEMRYEPWKAMQFFASTGVFKTRKDSLNSSRWELGTVWRRQKVLNLDYKIENIFRKKASNLSKNTWLRQRGRAFRQIWRFKPLVEFENEVKKEGVIDTLRSGFRFFKWTGGLGLENWHRITAELRYSNRKDDDRFGQSFRRKSIAKTMSYKIAMQNWRNMVMSASYIHRERNYDNPAFQNTKTDLAEIRMSYHAMKRSVQADARYQITNTQVNRQQRVYFKVREGDGNYRFDSDLNEYVQDPFGDYVLRLIPTDDFIPVVQLRSRFQIRLRPEIKLRERKKLTNWQKVLKALSSETLIRIEEKSRDPEVRNIYFLRLAKFQNPQFTLFGNMLLRQDFYLFQNHRNFSVRYRLLTGKNINNQFLEGEQRRRQIRHEIRLNLAAAKKIASQIEFFRTIEDKTFNIPGRQDRFVRGLRFEADVSYRPESRLELASRFVFGHDKDLAFSPATRVNQFSLKPRATYSFHGRGRLRAELEWTRVSSSPSNRIIPYELAQGNRIGNTFRWNLAFEYRVSNNLNASFSYQGRDEPDRPRTLHLAKVEMRAFF